MRGRAVAISMMPVVLAAGCASPSGPAAAPTPTPAATSATPSPAVPTTRSVRHDITLTTVNPKGLPPCGYQTHVDRQGPAKTTHLSFAVAVAPQGTAAEVRVAYQIEGEKSPTIARFKDGEIREARYTTPEGTTARYLVAEIGLLRMDKVVFESTTKFLNQPRIITVTVDPEDRYLESNEKNNVLRFRLAPPKGRQSLAIGDASCTRM